jgi:hypothetical protein
MDVSESVLKPTTPTTLRWIINASSSDDGTRMLFDAHHILDDDFQIRGRIDIPDYDAAHPAYQVGGIISPDGSRAYVLTYNGDATSGSTSVPPRVYVVETTGNPVGDHPVEVLGYFELPDYPGCLPNTPNCDGLPAAAISLDGRTLFFAGSSRLIVAPIAAEGTLTPASAGRAGAVAIRTQPWHLPEAMR